MLDEKKFKKIKEIVVPEYIYQVKVSENRRAKYFSNKIGRGRVCKVIAELPKKHKVISTDLEGFYLGEDGQRIIANPRSAGTAKYIPIKSNLFYASVHHSVRNKVMSELHKYWEEIFKDHLPFTEQEYPLFIAIDWYCPKKHVTQDIDNFTYINEKAIFDALHLNEIIPDDTVDYIVGQASMFHEVKSFDDRKLVISFYTYTAPDQLKLL